ncbi:MAG: PH domain-containing protein [Phycisphaerales bacterium]|nr:MAG: PH domain-containing protein [Phycisphaerales bacterium]
MMVSVDLQTKPCIFCAETIQAAAVKCRYCGEFLNSEKAKALQAKADPDAQPAEEQEDDDGILFAGRPSLLGLTRKFFKGLLVLTLAWGVIRFPLEHWVNEPLQLKLTAGQLFVAAHYRVLVGYVIGGLVVLGLLIKVLKLKTIYYEVSSDRIEWSRGILDRRVDNIDMFRVVDLKMRRSLLDCIFGVGTVALITTDKTDPEFVFEKIRDSRYLYDVIKKASLEADRKTGVVHLE